MANLRTSLLKKLFTTRTMNLEAESLRRQLRDAHMAENQLQLYKTQTQEVIESYKARIREADIELRLQRQERDVALREVTTQLLFFEGRLKKEQDTIRQMIEQKDKIIWQQADKIRLLTFENRNLRQAVKDTTMDQLQNSDSFTSDDSTEHTEVSFSDYVLSSTPRDLPFPGINSPLSMQMAPDVMIPRYLEQPSNYFPRHQSGYQSSDSGVDETTGNPSSPTENPTRSAFVPENLLDSTGSSATNTALSPSLFSRRQSTRNNSASQSDRPESVTRDFSWMLLDRSVSCVSLDVREIPRPPQTQAEDSHSSCSFRSKSPTENTKPRPLRPRDVKRRSKMRAQLALERLQQDSSSTDAETTDHRIASFTF